MNPTLPEQVLLKAEHGLDIVRIAALLGWVALAGPFDRDDIQRWKVRRDDDALCCGPDRTALNLRSPFLRTRRGGKQAQCDYRQVGFHLYVFFEAIVRFPETAQQY